MRRLLIALVNAAILVVCPSLAGSRHVAAQGGAPVRQAPPPAPPAAPAPPRPDRPAQAGADAAAARLPVRRVVLYKSGVGYFEHVGRVRDAQTVSIDLTSGQLDDVLKSLTTVDLGDGRVTGVTFNSIAPIEQRLRSIGLPLGASTSRAELLGAVRGSRVEVQSGAVRVVGRVLNLEVRERRTGDTTEQVEHLGVVTDAGAVHLFELRGNVGIRLLDGDVRGDLEEYLDALESSRAQDVRRMAVHTTGVGARDLFVSYVSEVPVWKSTYRLVIPPDGGRRPFLQGWAVVDNTLGEDWSDVRLSLVAGAPQSFVQPLSQPIYTRRPVVPLPTTALTTPQTHAATMTEAPAAQTETLAVEAMQQDAMAPKLARERARTAGGVPPPAAPAPTAPAPALVAERLGQAQAAATGADLGDLFEYALTQPVTIRRNQSALVPILQADVTIERVSIWNAASSTARPLRAVWLTNDTGATLDAGSIALMEGGTFAGEGVIEPITPREKRLISFATDLAGRVTSRSDGGPRRISRVRVAGGVLSQFVEERSTATYTARNEDAAPRTFVIEHPLRSGWTLAKGTPAPAESTAALHRFRLVVPPSASETLTVEEVHPIETRIAVSSLTSDHVALVLRGRNLDPAVEPQLRAVLAQSQEIARLQGEVRARRTEMEGIAGDQERVRGNLSALKGSSEERALTARYVGQLAAQEDRLVVLRREIDEQQAALTRAQQELARLVNAIAIDVELP